MNEETININLVIADRPYPLKIKPAEEEMVRNAAKELNRKIKDLKDQYAAKDKQDYLAMCALMYAVESHGARDKVDIDDTSFEDLLTGLEAQLEKVKF